jgi:hypothetical protein
MARSRWAKYRDIDAVVRRTDPLLGLTLDDEALTSSLEDMGVRLLQNAPQAPRARRRRALRAPQRLAVFAVLVLGVSGVAAAATGVFVNANTHRFTHGWQRRAAGSGELLNAAGTNYVQVVLRESAGISYPPGYAAWRLLAAKNSQPMAKCPKGSPPSCTVEITTGAVNGQIGESAFAAWVVDWRHARLAGQSAAAHQAAAVISGALRWKVVTSTDAVNHGYFGWITPFVRAVKKGSVKQVDRLIATHFLVAARFWDSDPTVFARVGHHLPDNARAYLRYLQTRRL